MVNKGSEFYNRSMKPWLQDNNIEMHLTHNEGKSDIATRFIRTSKNRIYKCITSVSKNVYIDKLDSLNIVYKYNHTYHRTIKIKSCNVKPSMNIDFDKGSYKKCPKFKVGDHAK